MNAVKSANYTKVKVQELQRTLYLAAKANTKRRFHALYDKVSRSDVMWEAWKRVKANRGSAGIDGVTIQYIILEYGEEQFVRDTQQQLLEGTYRPKPVRRKDIPKGDGKTRPLGIPVIRDRLVQMAAKIILEAIFEADFKDCSFGFRPKRSARQAIEEIRKTVNYGRVYWVVDVDITGYFNNIPHAKLLKLLEQRVSDRRVLKLIRNWLKAGVMEEGLFHDTEIGSPQGGVISPLLANIYLNYLDSIWEKQFSHIGTLVRYADDLVILCRQKTHALEAIQVLKAVFQKLELSMNTDKSKLVNVWMDEEGFDFLGFHHRRMPRLFKTGKFYDLRSFPSKKAAKKMRAKVKEVTGPRSLLYWSPKQMVDKLNPIIQGWKNYYGSVDPGMSNKFLTKVDWYIIGRLTLYWNKKHKRNHLHPRKVAEVLGRIGLKRVSAWGSYTAQGEEHRKAVCGKTARTV
ncbi:group II intron reverse transcriptase/maturase [Paenibacillus sp. V4I7]|uniref:group II intron reverse transcriptase/maturase n=1 Tax=Paenibacillus sp. V4I7 TaxID=3042307 RepID=UPI0027883B56|nr:group II intron reverse transcriptase/maturase [Paenibacillus sp. V4I7]MDQ0899900.1 RNA-directed DNA polymerase [Paenibacillus sp. V4I7]